MKVVVSLASNKTIREINLSSNYIEMQEAKELSNALMEHKSLINPNNGFYSIKINC